MAFNAEFSDNFDRADGTLGSNWTGVLGTIGVTSNKAKCTAISSWAFSRLNTQPSTTEQYAEAKLSTSATNFSNGFWLRSNTDFTTGYVIFFRSSVTDCNIYRRTNSNWNLLLDSNTFTMAANNTFKFAVEGTGATVTLRAYVNGTEVASATDTSADRITTVGYAGLFCAAVNEQFDDFVMGTIGDAPQPPATAVKDLIGGLGVIPFAR